MQQVRVDLVARRGFRRIRIAIKRLDPHPLHHPRDALATDPDTLSPQQIAQHPAARERVVEMQLIDPPHDRQIARRYRTGPVVEATAAQLQDLGLPGQRKIMLTVNHRFALSMPALLSAPAKKSFSSASSPILACSTFKSTAGRASVLAAPEPNTPAAPSRSCAFQLVIWFGCTSNCCARSASVFSPLMAASATFALKTGVWFRRVRFVMLYPDPRRSSPPSGRKSTYPPVQISQDTSHVITDVIATVTPAQGDPLLGQSFLSKLPGWTVDNERHALVLKDKAM